MLSVSGMPKPNRQQTERRVTAAIMANIRSVSSQFVFGLTVWLTFKGERKKRGKPTDIEKERLTQFMFG